MKCGSEIRVKDFYGATAVRFVAQCEGRFLMIATWPDHRNGYMLADWQGVLRELIAMCVPRALLEKTRVAEGSAGGMYVAFGLTYPLSANELAKLLGVPAAQVSGQLSDLAVQYDEV